MFGMVVSLLAMFALGMVLDTASGSDTTEEDMPPDAPISGTEDADLLSGTDATDDVLDGGGDVDPLVGDAGNDELSGTLGNDLPEDGADTFLASSYILEGRPPEVSDFDATEDVLVLYYDQALLTPPPVTIAEADGDTQVLMNGDVMAVLPGVTGLTTADIALLPAAL